MKATTECYNCLKRLAHQAASLATDDEQVKDRALQNSMKVLSDYFSLDAVSIVVATKIHDVIKTISGNPDPYSGMKDKEIASAGDLVKEAKKNLGKDFEDLLKLAALGNAIDFFRPLEGVKSEMRQHVEFFMDDSAILKARIRMARKILYLADNAGEVFFDLPLLKYMRNVTKVLYVVKEAPVQNDITLEDIKRSGVEAEIGDVITTGTATPGIDFNLASEMFKQEFIDADLIVAKGMGYYESLSELPPAGRIFYCLKAKCGPVAASLGVPVNSYVAILR